MVTQQKNKGFTIIEVVLVLAIAGLIFLMVFIALPTLQRGRRDTQRRDDVSRFISQLNSYSVNNNGNVPTLTSAADRASFLNDYMKQGDGEFKDPKTGDPYGLDQAVPTTKKLQYVRGSKCNGEEIAVDASGSTRIAAVRIKLEGAGTFCKDNQ